MRPLDRYFEQCSAWSPHTFTRCHSTRSCFWPALSFHTSLVAMLRLHTGRLLGVYFSSGSAPRLPTKMTLLTLPIGESPCLGCFCHLPPALSTAVRWSQPLSATGPGSCLGQTRTVLRGLQGNG